MKHITARMAAVLCAMAAMSPMAAQAQTPLARYVRSAPPLTVETEAFRYSYQTDAPMADIPQDLELMTIWKRYVYGEHRSFTTDQIDATHVVTGIFEVAETGAKIYILMDVNSDRADQRPYYMRGAELQRYLEDTPLELGDLLRIDAMLAITEDIPGEMFFFDEADVKSVAVVGNAFDCFGEAYLPVAQQEYALAANYVTNLQYGPTDMTQIGAERVVGQRGDVSGDSTCGVTDVIALTQVIHGTRQLESIGARLAADMNGDDVLDSFDLALLKRAVLGG